MSKVFLDYSKYYDLIYKDKDYQREAGILKIEFFFKETSPSRRRYSRYEEAYLQSTKSQHYKLAAG